MMPRETPLVVALSSVKTWAGEGLRGSVCEDCRGVKAGDLTDA